MVKLSEPSMELAEKLLREVGFEERVVGVKMTPRAGNRVSSIYSFEEVLGFLHTESLEDLLGVDTRSSVGFRKHLAIATSGKYSPDRVSRKGLWGFLGTNFRQR